MQLIPALSSRCSNGQQSGYVYPYRVCGRRLYPHIGGIPIVIVLTPEPAREREPAPCWSRSGPREGRFRDARAPTGVTRNRHLPVGGVGASAWGARRPSAPSAVALGGGTSAAAVAADAGRSDCRSAWWTNTKRPGTLGSSFLSTSASGWRRAAAPRPSVPRPIDDYAAILIGRRVSRRRRLPPQEGEKPSHLQLKPPPERARY